MKKKKQSDESNLRLYTMIVKMSLENFHLMENLECRIYYQMKRVKE